MKIGQSTDIPISGAAQTSPASTKIAQSGSGTAAATQGANPSGVAVTVSTAARSLDQVVKSSTAEVDMEKVNAVRSAIEQGTFKVNAEAIADKLLANAQEMLDRPRN